ncbi:MAG: hypothetical protein GY769_17275 [bacterium]|nr:hypothetical protein [bacterium]
MSRSMQKAVLCLLLAGLAVPVAAQDNAAVARYYRSVVEAADWPEAVMCGESFTVDVTMINPTNTKWTEADYHKLGPLKGEDEVFRPDGFKFKMPEGTEVPLRGRHTFTLELTAPAEEGTYETHWSMMTKGAPYGTPISQAIRVFCDDAELGRALFPEAVPCGEPFAVEVRMKNTGKSAWTEAKFYKLGPVMGTDEVFRPDGHKFKMPDGTEVAAGDKYAFELELMAPETPGTYETKWTMMKSGRPFGEEVSRNVDVKCKPQGFMSKEALRKDGRDM